MRLTRSATLTVKLGERDGWTCHYCGILLVPINDLSSVAIWIPPKVEFDHCACGKHQPGEPCVLEGYWQIPSGMTWPHKDHKTPKCLGGSNDPSNLVLACGSCNRDKWVTPYDEYTANTALARPVAS